MSSSASIVSAGGPVTSSKVDALSSTLVLSVIGETGQVFITFCDRTDRSSHDHGAGCLLQQALYCRVGKYKFVVLTGAFSKNCIVLSELLCCSKFFSNAFLEFFQGVFWAKSNSSIRKKALEFPEFFQGVFCPKSNSPIRKNALDQL